MTVFPYLKSLQALEMASRLGSLKDAADSLGITPAAVGQRVKTLEEYLGSDLRLRGRSGLKPTEDLQRALADLKAGFAALDRVTKTFVFQRVAEIHIVADPDWSELWLMPRLAAFRAENPNILFCINGAGDVPVHFGGPDSRIEHRISDNAEELYRDRILPVSGPDNLRRLAGWDKDMSLEGMPFLHLEAQRDDPQRPGWQDWVDRFGYRREGASRGVHYRHARLAFEAERQNVGFLVCGLLLVEDDISEGRVVLPFPIHQNLEAPMAYVLILTGHGAARPQLQRFCDWLRGEARARREMMTSATASVGPV